MIQNKTLLDQYDLSSVKLITTGAAPLGVEIVLKVQEQWPGLFLRQGYGACSWSLHVEYVGYNTYDGHRLN